MSRYYRGFPAKDLAAEFEESAPGGQIKLRVPSGAAGLLIQPQPTLHYTYTLHTTPATLQSLPCCQPDYHNHNLRK